MATNRSRLLLFLVFFPRVSELPNTEVEVESEEQYTWQTALIVAFICLLHGLATIIISVALVITRPHHLGTWANTLGVTATILAAIQYLPQIWMTYNLGHVGSLSIPMMLIQTPGSFVWSASLAARLGIDGWSTWGVFLVTGCLQGCLLVMGICFEVKARRAKQGVEGERVRIPTCSILDCANVLQSNGTCIVGYIPSPNSQETDDEGGANVETQTERTPLINGSRKSSRTRVVS